MKQKRLLVLISGAGSNMKAVIEACKRGIINAEVVAVIASNGKAGGLETARAFGIATHVCALEAFDTKADRDKEILKIALESNADIIVLAGFLGVLSSFVIERFKKKIINTHPSLLPRHGGVGYFGIKVHQSVIESKDKISGATVHFADEGTDTGEIILQKNLDVFSDDTPEALQKRVLKIEHEILTEALAMLCDNP